MTRRYSSTTLILMTALSILLSSCSREDSFSESRTSDQNGLLPWPTSGNVTAFCEDSRGFVWVGTEYGLNRYDGIQFKHYLNDENDSEKSFFPEVRNIFCDSKGRIWVSSDNGIDKMDSDDQFKTYTFEDKTPWKVFENNRGEILADMGESVILYDEKEDAFRTVIENSLGMANIDPSGNIWIVSDERISCYDKDYFKITKTVPIEAASNASFMDNNGTLWMGGTHLSAYSTTMDAFLDLPSSLEDVPGDWIWRISPYGKDSIVILSRNGGVILYNINTGETRSRHEGNLPFTIPHPDSFISAFMLDSRENVWIGTPDRSFTVARTFSEDSNPQYIGLYDFSVSSLSKDSQENLWLETTGGESAVKFNTGNFSYEYLANTPDNTEHGEETDSVLSRRSDVSLPFRHINFAVEDEQGNLWAGVLSTLVRVDRSTGEINRYSFSFMDGDTRCQFTNKSAIRLSGHRIAFGTNRGIVILRTDIPLQTSEGPSLHFEGLSVSNAPVTPGKESILSKDIDLTDKVDLHYPDRSLALSYCILSYGGLTSYSYLIKMDGIDKEWKPTISRNTGYSKLPYGSHLLHVKAVSDNGIDPELERTLLVNVHRPWWYSLPMMLLYLMLTLLTAYFFVKLFRLSQRHKEQAIIASYEKEQQAKMFQRNMNMFVNIAHEFRTPLTMISGAISKLSEEGKDLKPFESNRMHSIIQRNSFRMQKLVGQLLDFNKLENRLLRLEVVHTSPVSTLKNIVDSFYFGARNKDLSISLDTPKEDISMPLDVDKFEKIVYNLMSNAVKFSTMGGKIELSAKMISGDEASALFGKVSPGDHVMVCISDEGVGIPDAEKEKVFERYFRSGNISAQQIGGTGIGLYMTRQLTLLHHGQIRAENNPESKTGSLFRLILPASDAAYSEDEFIQEVPQAPAGDLDQNMKASYTGELISFPTQVHAEGKETVMIVDDDYEMLYFLRSILSEEYNVVPFYNATSAYAAIEEVKPDIIISDVLMLEMDGFKFCQMVKNNIATCHIIFILLTAKATTEDQIKGLGAGANSYVTKPFDPKYLLSVVKSQLSNAAILRDQLGRTTIVGDISEQVLGEKDKEFINKLYAIMEEELSNPELNSSYVADVMMMSRTSLYNKLKQLTGETPVTIFRKYKLNRSVEMLKEGKLKISAIAEAVGFSPSYFPKVFQEEFGMLPSQYLKQVSS
ncbi:MAG: response regulator [Bacteroidales bacterium]|nr:response regulator [Bacteroidales bacterium]MBQ9712480.1 response regulator [Bacteroidales bacterium]MBR1436506.1 response regulator [Bacteroidales bacterium]